jgi:hypothetical protein
VAVECVDFGEVAVALHGERVANRDFGAVELDGARDRGHPGMRYVETHFLRIVAGVDGHVLIEQELVNAGHVGGAHFGDRRGGVRRGGTAVARAVDSERRQPGLAGREIRGVECHEVNHLVSRAAGNSHAHTPPSMDCNPCETPPTSSCCAAPMSG